MTKKKPKLSKMKKYKSAYIFFTEENIPKYKKLEPKLLLREIFKLIGKDWKKLSKKEKEKYYKLENKSKETFVKSKENAKYNYKKKKVEIKKPIRYRTSFMIYLHENKNKIDKNNCITSLKNIGELWKELNEKERNIYVKKSEEDKIRYKNELVDYLKKKDLIEKNESKKLIKTR